MKMESTGETGGFWKTRWLSCLHLNSYPCKRNGFVSRRGQC